MDFYNLKAKFSAQKQAIAMPNQTDSFRIAPNRYRPYIQPTFEKTVFAGDRPSIILVSAIGATGKTTLAEVLSFETGLPLLDLGKHKPVGDNTLTGLLTSAFDVADLSRLFEGISEGTFGIIIDGIDEGRSKTNENAFDAFLDDLVRRCGKSPNTSFILLGRTQVLDECWVYLTDKGVSTGLISISPFDLDQARNYIDRFTLEADSAQAQQYRAARDKILDKLAAAFKKDDDDNPSNDFMSFIGYPPVLDAIVTLLQKEQNFHRLQQMLESPDAKAMETDLLSRIASYIAQRERDQKVIPNIVEPLIVDLSHDVRTSITSHVFQAKEQYLRLVAYCLGKTLTLSEIPEQIINTKYEEKIGGWLEEHPFLGGRQFKNAIFEAVAIATLIASADPVGLGLATEYYKTHRFNYYLIYVLDQIAPNRAVPVTALGTIIGCALEFRSRSSAVELHIESPEWNAGLGDSLDWKDVEIEIDIVMGADGEQSKSIVFHSNLDGANSVQLGPRLSATHIALPCEIVIHGPTEIELTAPVSVVGIRISLQSPALVLRRQPQAPDTDYVVFEAETLESSAGKVATNGVDFAIQIDAGESLGYPLAQFARQRPKFSRDPSLLRKYLKLRKILLHFRSHSRGRLAKYRAKVDNERIAGNPFGQAILARLMKDGILTAEGSFYYLQPHSVDVHLGISCIDLQKGFTSDKLQQYLRDIRED